MWTGAAEFAWPYIILKSTAKRRRRSDSRMSLERGKKKTNTQILFERQNVSFVNHSKRSKLKDSDLSMTIEGRPSSSSSEYK